MAEKAPDGPAAGQEVVITHPEDEEIDGGEGKKAKLPTALEDFRSQYGLPEVFSLVVKKLNPRKGNKEELVMEYSSQVPTTEELAQWHGVGDFVLYPSYRDAKGKLHKVEPPITLPISGAYYEQLFADAELKRNRDYLGRATGAAPAKETGDPTKQLRDTLALYRELAPPQTVDMRPLADAIKEQGANFREMIRELRTAQQPAPVNPLVKALLEAMAAPLATLAVKVAEKALLPAKDGKDDLDKLLDKGEKLKALGGLFGFGGGDKEDHWVDKVADRLERLMLSWESKGGKDIDPGTKEMIQEHPDFQKLLASPDMTARVWNRMFKDKQFASDGDKLKACKNALIVMRQLDIPVPGEFEKEYEELKAKAGTPAAP